MATRRRQVRAGKLYTFQPVGWDTFDSRTDATPGQVVRVVKLPGAPPPNTMGHAHIESVDGTFLGLVLTNSLTPIREH